MPFYCYTITFHSSGKYDSRQVAFTMYTESDTKDDAFNKIYCHMDKDGQKIGRDLIEDCCSISVSVTIDKLLKIIKDHDTDSYLNEASDSFIATMTEITDGYNETERAGHEE